MKKNKLLLAAAALVLGGSVWAQDWTDKTDLITNPSFETDGAISDLTQGGSSTKVAPTGWTVTYDTGSSNANTQQWGTANSSSKIQGIGSSHAPSDGDKYYYIRENWHGSTTYSVAQTISAGSIPAGFYRLSVKLANFASTATDYTLSIQEGNGTEVKKLENTTGSSDWQDWSVIAYKASDETSLTIKASMKGGSAQSSHWCLLLDDITLEYLAASSVSSTNTVDITSCIVNPSFEWGSYNGTKDAASSIEQNAGGHKYATGWTFLIKQTGWSNVENVTDAPADGSQAYETWAGNPIEFKVYQTLSTLPEGVYEISASARTEYSTANDICTYATVGGSTIYSDPFDVSNIQSPWKGSANWQTLTARFSIVGSGTPEVGIHSTKFMQFDNFHLTYFGNDLLLTDLKSQFNTWKATATSDLGSATYTNVTGSERTALTSAKDATPEETVAAWNTAITTLRDAIDTFEAAKTNYDALAAINTLISSVGTLSYADSKKKPSSSVTATSASDADTKTASQTTALRAYYESHALAEGVDDASDQTSLIGEPSVTATSAGAYSGSAWTTTELRINAGSGYTDSNGDKKAAYYDASGEFWGANSKTTSSMTQTLSALPIGRYMLTVCCRGSNSDALESLKLNAADQSLDVTSLVKGSTAIYGDGWNDASLEFTINSEQDVVISFVGKAKKDTQGAWFSVDNFRLVKLEAFTEAGSDDYSALDDAISAAEDNLGFENGEYAPYKNVTALEVLVAAKALNQSGSNAKSYVNDLTTTLTTSANWTANDGDVDAIYNGLFATVAEGQNYPDGWTRTNGWGQMQSGLSGDYATAYYNQPGSLQYGNQGIYTMPLAASQAYKLTFSYRSHENNSNNSMTASVLNGEDGLQATTFAGNGSTSEWVEATAFFTTGAAGNYVLTLGNSGNTWVTNVSLVKVTSATLELSDADGYTPTDRTYYETVDLTRTIKADTWSTFCVPFNMENSVLGASAEVKELTDATLNGDNYTLTFSDASSIVAGKPYMVRVPSKIESISVSGKTISSTITPTTEGDVTFTGVYTNDDAPMGSFIISNNAFYLVNSEVTLKAFRGYITVESSSPVKALYFDFDDDADGISTIENGQLTIDNAPIYNLAGQRIQKMQKGINIVNGRKVLY